jgi:hypothetical protein
MDTSLILRNASCDSRSPARPRRIGVGDIGWFLAFLSLGILAVLRPFFAPGLFATAAFFGCGWLALRYVRRTSLELWQILLLAALTGYIIPNYGFENVAFHVGGIPIIVSYLLMFASLALALVSHRHSQLITIRALQEPAMVCLLALLLLSCFHLLLDVPTYGIWAIRDASMFTDGIFLVLGLLWAMKRNSTMPLVKWLMVVFVLNLLYGYTLPWGEQLRDWSPKFGVFHQASLLGNYHGTDIYLLAGALFCIFVGNHVVKWPRWTMYVLTMAQLFGLAIHQARAMYLGLVVILFLLFLVREGRKSAQFILLLFVAFVPVLLLSVLGIEIPGRVGPVNMSFLMQNVRSIVGKEDEAGTAGATIDSRFDWYDQVFERIGRNPVLGEGFGQPLIDFIEEGGATVRQPHNSSVTVLARLGAVGLAIWVVFHLCLMKRFIHAFRRRRYWKGIVSDLVLWLFALYLVCMISISVQPGLEFPSGAVPFYFFVGFTLGLIRSQVPEEELRHGQKASFLPGGRSLVPGTL